MCFYCMCLFASFYFLFCSSFILYISIHVFFKRLGNVSKNITDLISALPLTVSVCSVF